MTEELGELSERLKKLEAWLHERTSALVDCAAAGERLDLLEAKQRELAGALLEYVRADMATPWMDSAKRLQSVLVRLLRDLE